MVDSASIGDDFEGAEDITPNLTVVSGRKCLGERVARRWLDLHGSLFYDIDYGVGIEAWLNAAMLSTSEYESRLEQEALKDECVLACDVTVLAAGEALTVRGRLTDKDGPFDLTVNVSSLTTQVLLEGAA